MVLDQSWNETILLRGHKGVTIFHVLAISTAVINFILNGIIWIAFLMNTKLLGKSHLYLFYVFAITNSLTGFATVPTYVNLFLHNNLNCARWTILIGSTFEIALDRVRSVLTLAIAMERIYALCCPGDYFFLDHKKLAVRICGFAVSWGMLDSLCMISEDGLFTVRTHCVTTSSSGPRFHWYFLISAIISGIFLTLVYFILICRLFVLRRHKIVLNRSNRTARRDSFNQANSLTVAVILMVLLFSVLPSSLYLYDMIVGKVVFMRWGPIITIGYNCYGILSFFFYNCKHRDIREALRKLPLLQTLGSCADIRSSPSIQKKPQFIRFRPAHSLTKTTNQEVLL